MKIYDLKKEILDNFFTNLKKDIKVSSGGNIVWTKYLKISGYVIRIINYSQEFTRVFDEQLSYVMCDESDKYDTTMVVWKNEGTKRITEEFYKKNLETNFKIFDDGCFVVMDEKNLFRPIIDVSRFNNNQIVAHDVQNNTYYYSVKDLSVEEFKKQGHLLVWSLYMIFQNFPNTSLVHGAVVGVDNKGILICARGGAGKSTLTVSTLQEKDFQYVSDDYLILSKENGEVRSYPIYSVVTLSDRVYKELNQLKTKFISDNWNRTKYILNISEYHDRFVNGLPIKACLFPNITDTETPSIEPISKGKAVVQMIDSTMTQLGNRFDVLQTQKLLSFVRNFDFYKINLSQNLKINVDILKRFIRTL
ncbi:MAG: hypothetical protein LBG48_02595 [Rickettsiales bacterium]|jgi:hypothetical protein|nr:hypothetical protein [Rickettsiales bacterium]